MEIKNLKFGIFMSKKSKGLTLIELIIYLAVSMLVLVVVIDLVIQVAAQKSANVGQNQVNENARFLAEKLTYEIQTASAINGSYPQNNLSLTVNGNLVNFALTDGKIYLQEGANPPEPITEASVLIEPLPSGSIYAKIENGIYPSIEIKFRITYKQANYSRDFETTATLKGK